MLNIKKNRLPHWSLNGSIYSVTFRLQCGKLNEVEANIVRDEFLQGRGRFYDLICLQVMPDHVHTILLPNDSVLLSRIIGAIKRRSAMKINDLRGAKGQLWAKDYFDRIIRSESDLVEKFNYIFFNPVRAGLVDDASACCGWWQKE